MLRLQYLIPAAFLCASDAIDTLVSVHLDAATCDSGTRGVTTCDSRLKVVAQTASSKRFRPFSSGATSSIPASNNANAGFDETTDVCGILNFGATLVGAAADEFVEVICLDGGGWIATFSPAADTSSGTLGADGTAIAPSVYGIAAGDKGQCGNLAVMVLTQGTADGDTDSTAWVAATAPTYSAPWVKVTGCPTPSSTTITSASAATAAAAFAFAF